MEFAGGSRNQCFNAMRAELQGLQKSTFCFTKPPWTGGFVHLNIDNMAGFDLLMGPHAGPSGPAAAYPVGVSKAGRSVPHHHVSESPTEHAEKPACPLLTCLPT